MATAAETIAAITNSLPRPQKTVDRIATPRIARESAARRRFRVWTLCLVTTFFLVAFFAPAPIAFGVDGFVGPLVAIVGVLWLASTQRFGHAAEIMRDGVAHPARVEERHGGGRSRIAFVVTWKDGDGTEGRRVLPPVSGAPPFGDEAVVLVRPGQRLVGVLIGDWLYVV